MTSASPFISVLDLDNPPTFAATVPAGGAQSSAADFDFTVSADAKEGDDAACLDFTISLKAAGKSLYAFSEVRCVTFGAELGPSCSPKPELCNSIDDDCDGKLDDDCVSTCGDGTRDPWEACDDHDTESGDGCSGDCLVSEGCGNGVVDPGEACDTAIAGSCPDKLSCEAKSDCSSQWTHSGVACQQTCTSKPASGTTCDDKDPCTTGDKCVSGTCVGTPKVCNDAPESGCTGSTAVTYTSETGTCKAGVCEYPSTKKTCKTKCSQGFCSPDVKGAGVAPVAGTFRSFALAETATAKAQLVYSGDDGIRMAEIGAEGPTGNDAPIAYTQGAGAFGLGAGAVAGKVKAAWLEESILYVGTEASPDFLTSWQTSSADWNYRDLTAAWTDDGLAHIYFRSANDSKLYYHVEGTTWSGTGVLSSVSDLGRAVAHGEDVWAPTLSGGKIVLYGNNGTDTIPGSSGGGEPAMAVGTDGTRYVVYRLNNQLVLATDTTGTGGAAWSGTAVLNLDDNHTGFSIAVNGKGTKCIGYGNNTTNEMAFMLHKGSGGAAYLIDDQFQSITNQERVTDLVAGVDGRFYMTYLTADSDGLVNVVIRPDE
ncbi:MAG: hypothetical protein IV100_01220 [Myxococcales bacterium]|nr:hypothetical protein [Myxococcales bacterium]